MSRKALYDLKEMFCQEHDEIARKPEMSAGDLETVHKLTDTIKNIDKICMMEESDYSQIGDWEMEGRGSYGRGNSYARARDSKGRYMSNTRTARYSRSGAKEMMVDQLEEMLESAGNDKERNAIRRCIEQIENV